MRKINRSIVAGLMSAPLVLGASGVAAADEDPSVSFGEYEAAANADGAWVHNTESSVNDNGYSDDDSDSSDHYDDGLLSLDLLGH